MKKDLRQLAQLVNLTDNEVELFVVTKNRKKVYETSTIRYVKGRFDVFGITDEDEVIDIYSMSANPKWYSCLARAMLRLLQPALDARLCGETDDYTVCKQLMEMIIPASQLYCLLNPDEQDMVRQEKSTLGLLTSPPLGEDPDSIEGVRLSLNKAIANTGGLDKFTYRSVYKRDALEISVLEGGLTVFHELFPDVTTSSE